MPRRPRLVSGRALGGAMSRRISMEFPISFWLDYAWNPERIGADDLKKYTEQWAASQFGNKYAKEIAEIISKYSKYNGRRKPELLDHNTYSLDN